MKRPEDEAEEEKKEDAPLTEEDKEALEDLEKATGPAD